MTPLFRLASYNILADAYIRPDRYPATEPGLLTPERRWATLGEKIEALDADVVCLQEVEQDVFLALERRLRRQGYAGVHARKQQNKPDGCATFFRSARLSLIGSAPLYYADGEENGTPPSGHLALITTFATDAGTIRVANTHLKWDTDRKPKEQHYGYRQIIELTAVLAESEKAAVICGDLNVTADSPVIGYIRSRGYADAYQEREQPTCYANRRAGRLDYIFYSTPLTAAPETLPEIDDSTPLPSLTEPSDHLAIRAVFAALS